MPIQIKETFLGKCGAGAEWWRNAVIYQIYPRSFADSNGDGIGDLVGISSKLSYLSSLGIDAIWLSPFYRSPQLDGGYDIADYCDVDPLFGTMDDFDRMLRQAHDKGIKVIIDLVPNHTSSAHNWFQSALKTPMGSAERNRYHFRDGKGENGELPPNQWKSIFGGDAWSRIPGETQWYLHLFDSSQPDLNWDNPEVRAEFEDILRFWLKRGVDGFRVDVAHALVKESGLPDWDGPIKEGSGINFGPMWDQEGVHDIYRSWNRVLKQFSGDRMLVAEAWVQPQSRLARYVRNDEMHQAFNFDYLLARWDAIALKEVIDTSLAAGAHVGAPTTWVMSNHDTVRHTSRYGLSEPGSRPLGIDASREQPDEALGLRRARAAALLTHALPGSVYIYQGEELGLPEHTTLDAAHRQDPSFFRTNGLEIGRDGCRVPIPWISGEVSYGFSTAGKSWLPQPESFSRYGADLQHGDSQSTLELYRQLLKLRRDYELGNGTLTWLPSAQGVLYFENGPIRIVINLNDMATVLPGGQVLISSAPIDQAGVLPANAAAWLK
ncbi:glycoside hydrolase family 13 protein [Pseudomonas sp. LjRoot263]|uniref:glycoside hydrolase family 13 protein n=1 Tax=Pseudomonas sp. LjRoot263 TaxID=3342302 RepID=UPI003ECEADC4